MHSSIRLRSSSVETPSGEQWCVGRRWATRGRPRWRVVPAGKAAAEAMSAPDVGGPEELVVSLGVLLGAVVVAVILIPLLLFGIELIVLGLLVAVGIVGRGLLGRPWIVQARSVDESTPALTWTVSGWRRSARVIDEVVAALAGGLEPSPAEAQDLLTLNAR